MRLLILITVVCLLGVTEARSKKKSTKDDVSPTEQKGKHKKVPSAIIAIEIVDPNENKTSSRNSKRTIESSLGYGYQQPKFEVYKYSQHDIPPYQGPKNIFSGFQNLKNQDLVVQKSVSYTLPSQKYTQVDYSGGNNHYQPGTRLYSTLDQQGKIGELSTNVPQNHQGPQVPVVILRVYPNQLNDPQSSLYANLPKSHPFAANINSIDIQSLLNSYMQNTQHHINPYVAAYQNTPALYQQPQVSAQQSYQEQPHLTAQQTYQEQPQVSAQQTYQEQPQTYQEQSYQQEAYQSQDQGYQYEQQSYTPRSKTADLLTHENYPSDTHTKVIFKDHKGQIRNKQRLESEKTIQIEIPENIKEVQVETSESPYAAYQPAQYDNQNYYYYQQTDQQQYEQPQAYEAAQQVQQDYVAAAPQYESYQQGQQYSGQPIVVADPQAYKQQQIEPTQQNVSPHQIYGQPSNVQYEETAQQYALPSEYYTQQLQQLPVVTLKPTAFTTATEAPTVYINRSNYGKRRQRSKKRMTPKQVKPVTEKHD